MAAARACAPALALRSAAPCRAARAAAGQPGPPARWLGERQPLRPPPRWTEPRRRCGGAAADPGAPPPAGGPAGRPERAAAAAAAAGPPDLAGRPGVGGGGAGAGAGGAAGGAGAESAGSGGSGGRCSGRAGWLARLGALGGSQALWLALGALGREPLLRGLSWCGVRLLSVGKLKPLWAALLLLLGYEVAQEAAGVPAGLPRSHQEPIPLPSYWEKHDLGDLELRLVQVDEGLRRSIEAAIRRHSHSVCVGRDGVGLTKNAKVHKVERIENAVLWKQYVHRKRVMADFHRASNLQAAPVDPPVPPLVPDVDSLLDPELNEVYLFHGTTRSIARVVARHGFDARVSSLQGLYGGAIYHACDACKASQYSKDSGSKVMIISRVCLGDPYYTTSKLQDARRPPERWWYFNWRTRGMTYDSVIANRSQVHGQFHREFMVYDHMNIYPEFIVHFFPQK